MAKRITQLSELTTAASDDYIVIVDTSTGTTKKITVKNLTGLPDIGWIATGESWSYSAWNSTLKRGTITVPSDATTKYQKGMFVRFSQSTGGTKWGYIVSVTSTTLVVYMGSSTLNNEAISSPVYSQLAQPLGVPSNVSNYNPYKFMAYRNAANTTSNSGAVVQYDTELYDTNDNFDVTTNKGRYTAPVSGFYHFTAQHGNSAATGTIMYCYLVVNGAGVRLTGMVSTPGVANNMHRVSGLVYLNAGDYIENYFIGGNASVGQTGQNNSYFQGYLVSEG